MVKMKPHPTLGIMVRSDGLVLLPTNSSKTLEHWTYGANNCGYREIMYKGRNYKVHRLVAETFIPNPDNKPQVDHIKREQKSNNDISNLRWVTAQENCLNRRSTAPVGERSIDFDTPEEYKAFRYKKWYNKKKLKEKK